MAEKPKGKWAESASGYRPGSASARAGAKPTRPWHVETPDAREAAGAATEREAPLAWARTLPVAAIEPDPEQPRRTFETAPLDELAASLREHGVLQPIVVRRNPEGAAGYIVVAGERRLRAARLAGLAEVPCMVLAGDSLREARLAQLAENLQREDLAAMEEALAVVRLAELEALSQEELARRLGKSPAYISRIFAVSRIPTSEYDDISPSKPNMSVLYEYAQVRDDAAARAAAADLIKAGATVRDLETLRGRRTGAPKSRGALKRGRPMSATAPLEALRRAVRALAKLDAQAARRLSAAERRAILAEQATLAAWSASIVGDDSELADAIARLEAALTRASGEPPSTRAGRADRAGQRARSSRPR